jgi:hypothetical protein
MRRWPVIFILVLGAAAGTATIAGAANNHGGPGRYGRLAYFAIGCNFSHRNQDDPIVFPNQAGRSHDHTFFGNTSTNAKSTLTSLREAGTTCRLAADKSAYWAPTLFVSGKAVEPNGVVAYYVRRTLESPRAFPAGLKVIAGNAAARAAQSTRIVSWSCGRRGIERSATIPTCDTFGRGGLRLQVNFPSCWNGRSLDSTDHKSHLAYPIEGRCPDTHPIAVPGLTLVISYPVAGGANAELSSGGQFSGHSDFVNAWDQRTLEALVDRYLNRF